MKRWQKITAGLLSIGVIGAGIYLWTPSAPKYDPAEAQAAAQNYEARIIRDAYGVPHIFTENRLRLRIIFLTYLKFKTVWRNIMTRK